MIFTQTNLKLNQLNYQRVSNSLLFFGVPGMALILLVKVQSGVFTTNRSEAQGFYREVELEEACSESLNL